MNVLNFKNPVFSDEDPIGSIVHGENMFGAVFPLGRKDGFLLPKYEGVYFLDRVIDWSYLELQVFWEEAYPFRFQNFLGQLNGKAGKV